MKWPIILGVLYFTIAQILAWFQSNGGILGGWISENYVWTALICGPIVATLFAVSTKLLYNSGMDLYSIRFMTFGLGYLIFMPLTWYFLDEHLFTVKNMVSFALCIALILAQAYLD